MNFAPVVLFVYNRPWHTRQTVEALRKNIHAAESDLVVYSDAAKSDVDAEKVSEVRRYLADLKGFASVKVVARDRNYGLAASIISGVTEVVEKYGRVIVLEDDMVTSPYFLQYMNDALGTYESDDKVVSVHGYVYPVKGKLPETFFLRGADCWGWATWQRGWRLFEPDGRVLLSKLEANGLLDDFDFNGAMAYSKMLADQIEGKNDSWAIRWHAAAFLQDKLTLYPGRSLVKNIGLDSTGTHCASTSQFDSHISSSRINIERLALRENTEARESFVSYFRDSSPKRNVLNRISQWIR